MSEHERDRTRTARYEKRRRTTKLMNYMLVTASALILFLISLFIFGDDEIDQAHEEVEMITVDPDDEGEEEQPSEEENNEETSDDQPTEDREQEENESENSESNEEEDADVEVSVEPSDEENVIEVIHGDWPAYPTDQSNRERLVLDDGSQDRLELEAASAMAIEGNVDDITYWWFGSEGGNPNAVQATIEDHSDGSIYRVYLEWIDDEGWKPVQVKVLEENDQLYRFQ